MYILREFVDKKCHFLYETYKCVWTEEYITNLFCNDGFFTLTYSNLHLKFRNEGGKFFLDFYSKHDRKRDPYSIDLFKYVMLKDDSFTAIMNDGNVNFLKENLDKIDELLSDSKLESSLLLLKEAMKVRVKKIFPKKK
jgi:hypothetical protein